MPAPPREACALRDESVCIKEASTLLYGEKQALFDVNMQIPEQLRHRLHRSQRLRQVDPAALLQPHERPDR
jgi:hypothetical protein